jgi:hypothetical protein
MRDFSMHPDLPERAARTNGSTGLTGCFLATAYLKKRHSPAHAKYSSR